METKKQLKKCPHCNKGVLRNRAKRPLILKATLFWLPIKRYECSYCYKKSYIYGSVFEHIDKADDNNFDDEVPKKMGTEILKEVKAKLNGEAKN
ncbi:hypothetical protein [Mucilaginibacter sp.]|jgi:uncharacterized protein with PIN domain|uniref:hypothetical protein n=1 Tax=Mucilaginibacter sp. TaxID=1882438 RepID=UPI003569E231